LCKPFGQIDLLRHSGLSKIEGCLYFSEFPEILLHACRGSLSHQQRWSSVALSEIDRNLLQRCLKREPRSWEDFVDRFLGLVVHVVDHTAQCRSIRLTNEDREDVCGEVFLTLLKDDFAVLRHFRGESSLATYLTVISRRVVVREMLRRRATSPLSEADEAAAADEAPQAEKRISDRDEVQRLLAGLDGKEAEVVRMYHLEGRSYEEISSSVGMPANSVGPTLSRARQKLREASSRRA
jgi:RNA polymerase sigma-70 factor (ECF subfamily)